MERDSTGVAPHGPDWRRDSPSNTARTVGCLRACMPKQTYTPLKPPPPSTKARFRSGVRLLDSDAKLPEVMVQVTIPEPAPRLVRHRAKDRMNGPRLSRVARAEI